MVDKYVAGEPFLESCDGEERIFSKIDQGDFYDAYQMSTALINRQIFKGQHSKALTLCVKVGLKFLKKDQNELTSGLGLLLLNVLKEFEITVTESIIHNIILLFESKPPTRHDDRYRFIERAIQWTRKGELSGSERDMYLNKLHNIAAKAYEEDHEFGLAQMHYLSSSNIEGLAQLTRKWQNYVYPNEKDLLVLRIILTLLSQNKTDQASELLQSTVLGYDFDDKQLSPILQFAYLLPEACKLRDTQFFGMIKTKYSLVIRRDQTFSKLLNQIETYYFMKETSLGAMPTDLMSLMSRLFQS